MKAHNKYFYTHVSRAIAQTYILEVYMGNSYIIIFRQAQALNEYFYAHVVHVQLHMCAFLKFKSSCTIYVTGLVEIPHAVTLSQVLYMCGLCYCV